MDKRVVSRHEYYKLFDVVLPESYLLLILDESPSVEPEGEVSSTCFYLVSILLSVSFSLRADKQTGTVATIHNQVGKHSSEHARTSVCRGSVGPLFPSHQDLYDY